MPPAYQVRLYDWTGNLLAVTQEFTSLTVEHRVNHVSNMQLVLHPDNDVHKALKVDYLLEVRRRVPEAGLDWYTEYVGFHRTPQRQITLGDHRIGTSFSVGLLDLIRRRSVLYYADTDGAVKGPGHFDDIIKQYVRENVGLATPPGPARVLSYTTPNLSVAVNQSLCPGTYEGGNAWRNLLETIQDIADPHNVAFDVKLASWSPLLFEFRTYHPIMGTDRRVGTAQPMVFAPNLGNMNNPSHTLQRINEVTQGIVLGPGEGPLRDVTVVTSPHNLESPWNHIEETINASNEDREAALIDIGHGLLFDRRPAISFTFDAIQTPHSLYGKHYFLDDLVTGAFDEIVGDVRIRAVRLNIGQDSVETVTMELEEITPDEEV